MQSFRTLLAHLGTRSRNTCVVTADPKQTTFYQVTDTDALQAEALRLIKMWPEQEVQINISHWPLRGMPLNGPGTSD